ncbi:MAG: DUF6371 domain-containing protein [Mucilaginibacter sp.]
MTNNPHRYTLEPYHGRASRYACPKCNHHRHTFKRYMDTETGEYLADNVGKCDRADGCGYHYPPREYFAGNKPASFSPGTTARYFDTLPRHLVDDTARGYERNNFVQFLVKCFGEHTALRLASLYKIGTSKHWLGATIFWQIDVNDRLRTGKIMLYNPADGHRIKQPFNHISWAHALEMRNAKVQLRNENNSAIGNPTSEFNLKQCLFGEHLLNTDPFKTVAIAESEKTAVICSFIYPKYIWLACGSLQGINLDKCSVLKDRRVILFPDVNGYDKWRMKAREMKLRLPGANFTVDDTLERLASADERSQGVDIADRWIEQLLIIKP